MPLVHAKSLDGGQHFSVLDVVSQSAQYAFCHSMEQESSL